MVTGIVPIIVLLLFPITVPIIVFLIVLITVLTVPIFRVLIWRDIEMNNQTYPNMLADFGRLSIGRARAAKGPANRR